MRKGPFCCFICFGDLPGSWWLSLQGGPRLIRTLSGQPAAPWDPLHRITLLLFGLRQ
nr:MAG TPA: hypothetical protein [Caudoviricetes sp.]